MSPNKLSKYMKVAKAIAQFSPDKETKVGSLLINKDDGSIMGLAYNGFVRGADDANLPTTRPHKYDVMQHSETNLIYNSARNGVRTSGCFVVCTLSPCINCIRALYQSGIHEIYYETTYRDFEKNLNMKDLIINLTKIGRYTKIELKGSKK